MGTTKILSKKRPISVHGGAFPIITLIILNLIIGVLTFRNYGESFDEARLREYANQSLDAYQKWIHPSYQPDFGGDDLRFYGPAYAMGVTLITHLIGVSSSVALVNDTWHLANFITFQVAILSLYWLAKRWINHWAAFGAAVLFSTQPLLWGHAFINPKDIPFLAFFTASIALGYWMVDRSFNGENETVSQISVSYVMRGVSEKWRNIPKFSRKRKVITSLVCLASMVTLAIGSTTINGWIADLIHGLYSADPLSIGGRLFSQLAQHASAIPVEEYIAKAQTQFRSIVNIFYILGILLIIWIYRSIFPFPLHWPSKREMLLFIKQAGSAFIRPPVLLAGVMLGLTTSIRIIGPLAGGIVCLYAGGKKGLKAFPILITYAILTIISMYLTWPSIWSHPVQALTESITTMSSFPWLGRVLFNGNYYSSDSLPGSYVPVLMSIQFTEAAIILFWAGVGISLYKLVRHENIEPAGIGLLWFIIPVVLLVSARRPLYDNFRQLLFLTPAIFLFCGVSLNALFHSIRKWPLQLIILCLVVAPGIWNIIKLHPYEYIYYNSFTGGQAGAFRRYETDYWMTSFREAAEYLNRVAEPNARIVVWEGGHLVSRYSRPDLIVEREKGNTYDLVGGYQYAVLSSRNGNEDIYPDALAVFTVQRENSILAVVKRLSPASSP